MQLLSNSGSAPHCTAFPLKVRFLCITAIMAGTLKTLIYQLLNSLFQNEQRNSESRTEKIPKIRRKPR
jgi:hypothetical protein